MPTSATSTSGPSSIKTPLLLDTHVAIWLAQTSPQLKPSVLAIIERAFHENILCLSPISAWEIGMLVSQSKLHLSQPPLVWVDGFIEQFDATILDITTEIAINSSYLPGKFHRDPADRLLIATARANSAAIVTADKNMIAYSRQGFVEVIAC